MKGLNLKIWINWKILKIFELIKIQKRTKFMVGVKVVLSVSKDKV